MSKGGIIEIFNTTIDEFGQKLDTQILQKSDLEYVRYFIALMDNYIRFSLDTKNRLVIHRLTKPSTTGSIVCGGCGKLLGHDPRSDTSQPRCVCGRFLYDNRGLCCPARREQRAAQLARPPPVQGGMCDHSSNALYYTIRIDDKEVQRLPLPYTKDQYLYNRGQLSSQHLYGLKHEYDVNNMSSSIITQDEFIYFLQIEIHTIIQKCVPSPSASNMQRRSFLPIKGARPLPNKGGRYPPTADGLIGEIRYKFNKINDIRRFIKEIEMYLRCEKKRTKK